MPTLKELSIIFGAFRAYYAEYNRNIFKITETLDEEEKGMAIMFDSLVMRKIGLEVPFSVELSKKLKLYNLVSDIKLDLEGLVNELWK